MLPSSFLNYSFFFFFFPSIFEDTYRLTCITLPPICDEVSVFAVIIIVVHFIPIKIYFARLESTTPNYLTRPT